MIEVVHPGILNTVQDRGRTGVARFGVPVAGVLDARSADACHGLLGQSRAEALIEITLGQGRFRFLNSTTVCLTGADVSPRLDGAPIDMHRVVRAESGSVLSFGARRFGVRTYLGVHGGIRTDVVLGSRSFTRGITQVRLEAGDVVACGGSEGSVRDGPGQATLPADHFTSVDLACTPGPEFDRLTADQRQRLMGDLTISADNDRVGYRLNEVIENTIEPILSSAVLPGTVQLTPSGHLIVLMNDGPVTGGYPRVLQLTRDAVSRLAQRGTGDAVRFVVGAARRDKEQGLR